MRGFGVRQVSPHARASLTDSSGAHRRALVLQVCPSLILHSVCKLDVHMFTSRIRSRTEKDRERGTEIDLDTRGIATPRISSTESFTAVQLLGSK